MPIVVYQGFSVHGDEPSGSNAALPFMYHLLASDSEETIELLDNVIILLDPSLNPDGLQRFSQWANSNKNQSLNPDPNDREYNQYWPRGRTNHYWFDLNRDYLPNQLIETKPKIQTYTEWLPNILTDHHEMGTNSSFFFQPGVPERKNPLISDLNQELTREIGTYHEEALNEIGSLYYSEEDYDDFFFGKGSTYPDANGGIGILFEQGSSRGHIQESVNGILTFPFTIRNQLTTAFSTVKAAKNMRVKLLNYMKDFYDNQIELNPKSSDNIVFGKLKDESTVYHLADLLNKIKQAGIVGLGGSGFPTTTKLQTGKIKTIIVNAAECEPAINADNGLIQNSAVKIIEGIAIAAYILGADKCYIGIEDDKPEALSRYKKI